MYAGTTGAPERSAISASPFPNSCISPSTYLCPSGKMPSASPSASSFSDVRIADKSLSPRLTGNAPSHVMTRFMKRFSNSSFFAIKRISLPRYTSSTMGSCKLTWFAHRITEPSLTMFSRPITRTGWNSIANRR